MSDESTQQPRQTVHGPQINAGGDVNVGQVGDNVDTGGGDYVGRDKIAGDVVVTGHVAGDVVVKYGTQPEMPPPPPLRPPEVDLLVGRDDAIAYYESTIAEAGLAVIGGMAGVGKTTLAAALARRLAVQDAVFWHAFHEGEGVDAVIWRLAGFLAGHGQDELWRMLLTTAQVGGRLPPPEMLFDFLLQQLRSQSYLLCFDDFHHVDDDPRLNDLVARLSPLLAEGALRLIITTRRIPEYVKLLPFEPLAGIDEQAVGQLLAANDVYLEAEQVAELHTYTGGNAELLTLAIDLFAGALDSESLLKNLVETDDIEDFLMDEIEARLTRNERMVMAAVAILEGYPGSRPAIEAILDGRRIRRVVRDLADRYLLTVTRVENGRLFGQHAIVQAFFYESLNKRQRRRMHRRAAAYYRQEEIDFLLAARHYLRAGDQPQAAELATAHVYTLLNQGQARQLDRLLARFDEKQLNPVQQISVKLAGGQTKAFLGDNDPARDSFRAVLSHLSNLFAEEEHHELKAQAYLGMGELLELQEPREALALATEGLAETQKAPARVRAALTILSGTLSMHLGDYAIAQEAIEEGLALLGPEPGQERCQALITLSSISFYRGLNQPARTYAEEALLISRQLYDLFREARSLSNLAVIKFVAGEWTQATACLEDALRIARRLGSRLEIAEFQLNLGAAYVKSGAYARAEAYLIEALQLADQIGNELTSCTAHFHLAELKVRMAKWPDADEHLVKAEQLAQALGADAQLPAIYSTWTEVALRAGDVEVANQFAQRALQLARKLGDPFEIGIAMRASALVKEARGDHEQARLDFQQSGEELGDLDPYEAARSQLLLAKLLVERQGDVSEGRRLAESAREVFDALGASRDASLTKQVLEVIRDQ